MRVAQAGAIVAVAIAARSAAADPGSVSDAPAPPTLQALVHQALTASLELTTASIKPTDDVGAKGRATAWFLHTEVEQRIASGWYAGGAEDVAGGAVPDVGDGVFVGSPELWIRGLWSSGYGLSSGGGLGVVMPAPRDFDPSQQKVLDTVRVARPWDASYFDPLTLTLRPWVDIRHVTGRVILQLRQGLDVSLALGHEPNNARRTEYTAVAGFYVGVRATPWLGLGLELWESYALTAAILDDQRASFALSPGFRLITPGFAPAFSLLFPVSTPLKGEAQSYFALRFNMSFNFDESRRAH